MVAKADLVLNGIPARLRGTGGQYAVIGEGRELPNSTTLWQLHPAYAAWFWPLMNKATHLALVLPRDFIEDPQPDDNTSPPPAPTEQQKREILRLQELTSNCARVYTLAIHGKSPLIQKGFPTRSANLAILRDYRPSCP